MIVSFDNVFLQLFVNDIEQTYQLAPVIGTQSLPADMEKQSVFVIAPENSTVRLRFEDKTTGHVIAPYYRGHVTIYGQLLFSRGLPTNFEIGSL